MKTEIEHITDDIQYKIDDLEREFEGDKSRLEDDIYDLEKYEEQLIWEYGDEGAAEIVKLARTYDRYSCVEDFKYECRRAIEELTTPNQEAA